MLARGTKRKLFLAVLRPINQQESERIFKSEFREGMPSAEFNVLLNKSLGDACRFMGYLKPKCKKIFDANGIPTGATLQPGDVMDEIEEFNKAIAAGAYQKVDHAG